MHLTGGSLVLLRVFAIVTIVSAGARALHAAAPDTAAAKSPKAPPASWAKVSVALPTSPTLFPPGDGADIANSYCLTCHSAGMVLHQPALSQEVWTAEINKMRTAFGATVPAEQVEALAKYLSNVTEAQHQVGTGAPD